MFCKNCGNQVPEGTTFCAACGTAVAPAAPAAEAAAPKADKSSLIKLIAVVAAVAIVLGLFISLLGGGSAKSVAKDYLKASFEGDRKEMYSLMAGKMQKYFEENVEDEDEFFEMYEEICENNDVDVKIKNFNQLYKAMKKLTAAQMEEEYGKNAKLKLEIKEVETMNSKELKAIKESYEDNEDMEEYINPDKIKKGKIVTVHYYINGSEGSDTDDVEIQVVKYKGKWKVVN